jgi:hypothetical protein
VATGLRALRGIVPLLVILLIPNSIVFNIASSLPVRSEVCAADPGRSGSEDFAGEQGETVFALGRTVRA